MDISKDYYAILGITAETEDVVVRAAYKALAQKYHPDKLKSVTSENAKKMAEINEAYVVLSDQKQRLEYDHARKQRNTQGTSSTNKQNEGANKNNKTYKWHAGDDNDGVSYSKSSTTPDGTATPLDACHYTQLQDCRVTC